MNLDLVTRKISTLSLALSLGCWYLCFDLGNGSKESDGT